MARISKESLKEIFSRIRAEKWHYDTKRPDNPGAKMIPGDGFFITRPADTTYRAVFFQLREDGLLDIIGHSVKKRFINTSAHWAPDEEFVWRDSFSKDDMKTFLRLMKKTGIYRLLKNPRPFITNPFYKRGPTAKERRDELSSLYKGLAK